MRWVSLSLMPDKTPPREFRIFEFTDELETVKGTFKFSRANCAELLRERASHNAELEIDYEHDTYKPITGPKPAAGWCKLEARDDGLWAVEVRWTPKAQEYLRNSEYRYFSPVFGATKDTKEIVQIANLALTNVPAMKDIEPLVAASIAATNPHKETTMAKATLAQHLTKYMKDQNISPATFGSKIGIETERMRAVAAGEAPSQEEMKTCMAAMGLKGEDVEGYKENDAPDTDEGEGGEPPEKTPPEDKRPTVQSSASNRGVRGELDLVALTGKTDAREQLAVIAGWEQNAELAKKHEVELTALKAEREENKRVALVVQGKAEGKLTPTLITYWAKRPVADFEDFLAAASPIFARTSEGATMDQPSPKALTMLSAADIEVAEIMGRDTEEVAAFIEAEKNGENRKAILASYDPRKNKGAKLAWSIEDAERAKATGSTK